MYRRIKLVLALIPLLLYIYIIVIDYASLEFYNWRSSCRIEVFDVYGYARGVVEKCYFDMLELRDYMHLGETDAEVTIIATHYFTSPRGEIGLGTSEKIEFYYPLIHPIRAFYIVKGILPGSTYVAAPPRAISMSNLTGKNTSFTYM